MRASVTHSTPFDGDGWLKDTVGFALGNLQKEAVELTVHQKEALKSILSGKDTFVCLPTGYGTSTNRRKHRYIASATQIFFLSDAQLSWVAVTSPSPSTVSLPVFINLYFCSGSWQQQMQKCLYFSISPDVWPAPTTQNYCSVSRINYTIGVSLIMRRCEVTLLMLNHPSHYHCPRHLDGTV